MYVMIPSNIFFFTLGVIVGVILLFLILVMLSKKQQKKQKESVETFLKNFSIDEKDDK